MTNPTPRGREAHHQTAAKNHSHLTGNIRPLGGFVPVGYGLKTGFNSDSMACCIPAGPGADTPVAGHRADGAGEVTGGVSPGPSTHF